MQCVTHYILIRIPFKFKMYTVFAVSQFPTTRKNLHESRKTDRAAGITGDSPGIQPISCAQSCVHAAFSGHQGSTFWSILVYNVSALR